MRVERIPPSPARPTTVNCQLLTKIRAPERLPGPCLSAGVCPRLVVFFLDREDIPVREAR